MTGQNKQILGQNRNTCTKTEMTGQNEQKYLDKNRNTCTKTKMPGQNE